MSGRDSPPIEPPSLSARGEAAVLLDIEDEKAFVDAVMQLGCKRFLAMMDACPNLKRRVNRVLDGAPCTHPLKCFRQACDQYALVYPACNARATMGAVLHAWSMKLTPKEHRQVAAAHQLMARAKEIHHVYSRVPFDATQRIVDLTALHSHNHMSNPVRHACDKLTLRMLANAQKRLGVKITE